MRTIRIHVDLPLTVGGHLVLPAQAAEHVVRVLRLAAGAEVTLFNGDGCDYRATLLDIGKKARVHIVAGTAARTESPLALTLGQALARGEKMDLIVQKATELGVARIVPLLTERSEVRLDANRADKRLAHWRAVAVSACEQCGRARLPTIAAPLALDAWLRTLDSAAGLRLALLPDAELAARDLRFDTATGVLVVGPEGGLGERDTAALRSAGFCGLRLGPRILRTETAGLAALAALQALHGDA
jgi:16S rRNA (uracil1498-N3)-methyltransferase